MVEPNWYKDPRNPEGARWHDGEKWTEHTAPLEGGPPPPPESPAAGGPASTGYVIPDAPQDAATSAGAAKQIRRKLPRIPGDRASLWPVLAVVGIVVVVLLVHGHAPNTANYGDRVTAAQSDADTNEATAQGAPQQAVVNGWQQRDLTEIQIDQSSKIIHQQYELEVLLAAVAVAVLATAAVGWVRRT